MPKTQSPKQSPIAQSRVHGTLSYNSIVSAQGSHDSSPSLSSVISGFSIGGTCTHQHGGFGNVLRNLLSPATLWDQSQA